MSFRRRSWLFQGYCQHRSHRLHLPCFRIWMTTFGWNYTCFKHKKSCGEGC